MFKTPKLIFPTLTWEPFMCSLIRSLSDCYWSDSVNAVFLQLGKLILLHPQNYSCAVDRAKYGGSQQLQLVDRKIFGRMLQCFNSLLLSCPWPEMVTDFKYTTWNKSVLVLDVDHMQCKNVRGENKCVNVTQALITLIVTEGDILRFKGWSKVWIARSCHCCDFNCLSFCDRDKLICSRAQKRACLLMLSVNSSVYSDKSLTIKLPHGFT